MTGFKCLKGLCSIENGAFSFVQGERLVDNGHFYFLSDQYFIDFPDKHLVQNKSVTSHSVHDRPCYCAFQDTSSGLYWMIPISSQLTKFHKIYASKVKKYGRCDTILFGHVLGYEKAFLIQNMCPVSSKYVKNEYIDKLSKMPVRLDKRFEKKLIQSGKKVLRLQRNGKNLIFPDIQKIESGLLAER